MTTDHRTGKIKCWKKVPKAAPGKIGYGKDKVIRWIEPSIVNNLLLMEQLGLEIYEEENITFVNNKVHNSHASTNN